MHYVVVQSEFEEDLRVDGVEDILSSIPESATGNELSPWLANDFIPFIIRIIPEELVCHDLYMGVADLLPPEILNIIYLHSYFSCDFFCVNVCIKHQ